MMNKIKNGLTFVAGMVAGLAALVGFAGAWAVWKTGGYSDRFGVDVLKTEWPEKEDDDEND